MAINSVINKITIKDSCYPKSLLNISNPPKVLYMQGNLELLNNPIISIIGSRSCSLNGKNLARKFAYELSQCGVTIASGLAEGIDTISHLYSYNEKGKTIAVLGNGFNHIFPKENIGLYGKILNNDGLVISEYPPDTKARSKYFLERNRIVSGISSGVLVVEAAYRSGTSVTAKLAESQGKKVFALPHEIWDLHGVGTNRLLKNGAILVTCIEDLLENLNGFDFSDAISSIDRFNINSHIESSSDIRSVIKSDIRNANNISSKKDVDTKISKSANKKTLDMEKFKNSKYQFIYDLITDIPISINEICKKTNESVSVISNILFLLELEGYVMKVAGGYVCILDN